MRIPRGMVCLAVMAALLVGASGAEEIVIRPSWKVGETHRYVREKGRSKTSAGKTVKGVGTGPVDVSVIEAGPKGWVVGWTNGDTRPSDPKAVLDANTAAVAKIVDGMKTELVLDQDVVITGVRNWKDLQKTFAKLVDATVEAQRRGGADDATLTRVRNGMAAMFTTKEGVEQLASKEASLFFFPIGRAYPAVGKGIVIDDELPSPLGGGMIRSKGTITLASYDPAKGRAVVAWTQETDPKSTARVVTEALKKLSAGSGRTPPNAEMFKDLRVSDRAEFVIDLKGGWVERFSHTRTTTIGGNSQSDTLSMTLQPK